MHAMYVGLPGSGKVRVVGALDGRETAHERLIGDLVSGHIGVSTNNGFNPVVEIQTYQTLEVRVFLCVYENQTKTKELVLKKSKSNRGV